MFFPAYHFTLSYLPKINISYLPFHRGYLLIGTRALIGHQPIAYYETHAFLCFSHYQDVIWSHLIEIITTFNF